MPEKDIFYINKLGIKIKCNRFNIWTDLMQHWVVDQFSRFNDSTIAYQKNLNSSHFKKFGGSNSSSFDDSSDSEDDSEDNPNSNKTKQSIIGESVTGSNRHLKKLSLKGLHIVQKKGKPHIFGTFTCDKAFEELVERLAPNQTAFDRAEITQMVFQAGCADQHPF
jgi:hypothetical protein